MAEIFPDDSFLLYNLACAQARSGLAEAALASLGQALDHGLAQPLQMATDADLASLENGRSSLACSPGPGPGSQSVQATEPAPQ